MSPKASKVINNDILDRNNERSNLKIQSENQTPIDSDLFKESIYKQHVKEEDSNPQKPFLTDTKDSAKNPNKNINNKTTEDR